MLLYDYSKNLYFTKVVNRLVTSYNYNVCFKQGYLYLKEMCSNIPTLNFDNYNKLIYFFLY